MTLKETYNLIAEDWHREHQTDGWWVEGTDRFISLLKPGALVLDAGCGGGTKAKYLIARGLKVVGVDFAEKFIDIARRENPSGKFLVSDLQDINGLSYEFDGILAQAVLLHIPKKEIDGILKKMSQKLRKGGYICVAVKEMWPGEPEETVKDENDYGYPYRRFFSFFTQNDIRARLESVGLEIVYSEVKPSGKTNWIQIMGKKR